MTSPIKIYTDQEAALLLQRYGTKYLKVITFCKQCKKEYMVQLYRLKTGNLCRTCKISQTKKNASTVQKRAIQEKRKKTCLEKYGVDNTFKNEHIKEKIKQTMQQKYGVSCPANLRSDKNYTTIKERKNINNVHEIPILTETQLEAQLLKLNQLPVTKWDTWTELNIQKALEKRKQTNLKKYGVDIPTKNEQVKNKLRHAFSSKEVRDKVKQTMLQRYGSGHVSKKYIHENISFDSSWELAVWIWANETGKNITREPIGLEYEFEHKIRTYYPDFEIDGQLVEVKGPQFFKKDGTMQNPFNHSLDVLSEAKHQCGLQHNVQFWSKKEMEPVLDYIKEKYGKDWINRFKN